MGKDDVINVVRILAAAAAAAAAAGAAGLLARLARDDGAFDLARDACVEIKFLRSVVLNRRVEIHTLLNFHTARCP